MTRLVRSPFWDNWFIRGDVERSLIICSPYFKKNALDKIIDQFELDDDECILDIKILIRGKLEDFVQGSSDLTALDALLGLRCINIDDVRRVTNLHMKAYLRDEEDLLIGSGNCTGPGLSFGNRLGNVEAGIQTFDENVIGDFYDYFDEVFEAAEPLAEFYDSLTEQYSEEVTAPIQNRLVVTNRNAVGENAARFDYRNHGEVIVPAHGIEMTIQDIPQFSNFDQAVNETLHIAEEFTDRHEWLTYDILGELLPGNRTDTHNARTKYGENHAKTAELLEFVAIIPEQPRKIIITPLGRLFLHASPEEKDRILVRQLLRTTIVQDMFNYYTLNGPFDILDYLEQYLSHSTAVRRRPNVRVFFQILSDLGVEEADTILNNVF